ncbi:MAG: hypothetical protein K2L51_01080 [Clostridiales bacterium]|nr:hypothetical protein [Clostridiales bacterium]
MQRKKKQKIKYVDDGRTVYNMDGVGGARHREDDKENAGLSRKERRAAIRAGLETYLPVLLTALAAFTVVAVLLYFWIR